MRFFSLAAFSLQFMTALPINKNFDISERDFAKIACFFPFSGFVVGAVMAAVFMLFCAAGTPVVGAVAAVAAECLVTGGLHLDGAADFFDAFGARKSKERTLEILKDSRVGTFGVAAIVLILLSKTLLIISLDYDAAAVAFMLFVTPVAGKVPMVTCGMLGSYPRERGTAKRFVDNIEGWHAAICITVCACLMLLFSGYFCSSLSSALLFIAGYLMYKVSTKRIGGVTGDILGASNEFGEILFMIVFLFLGGLM